MIQPNAAFTQAVQAAVERVEAGTDAELVVVAASRSGSYRDLAAALAGLCCLGALLGAAASPWIFSPVILAIELALLALALSWLFDRSPWLLRPLSSAARRKAQVDDAANAAFYAEGIHTTPERAGVLVYLSAMEGEVRVLADTGLLAPQVDWDAGSTAGFVASLERLGAALAELRPAGPGTNPNHLGNAPRVRP